MGCFRSLLACRRSLSVTRPAGFQLLNVILLHQPGAEFSLRFLRLIPHRRDLVSRAKIILRIAVAVETPAHLQRRILIREAHRIDASMAGFAADALLDMN